MKEKIKALFKEYYNDETMPVVELEDKVLALFAVVGRSEQLRAFSKWYEENYQFEISDRAIQEYERYGS